MGEDMSDVKPPPLALDADIHTVTSQGDRLTCSQGDWSGDTHGEWWNHVCELGRARRARALAALRRTLGTENDN